MFLGEEKVQGQRGTVGRRVKLEAQIGEMLLPAKKYHGLPVAPRSCERGVEWIPPSSLRGGQGAGEGMALLRLDSGLPAPRTVRERILLLKASGARSSVTAALGG